MVISNENNYFDNPRHAKCSILCEDENMNVSSFQECERDLLSTGFSPASVQTENCYRHSLSQIEFGKNHLENSSYTAGVNEKKLRTNFETKFKIDHSENEFNVGKQDREHNFITIPENMKSSENLNRRNKIMLLNYHFLKNGEIRASNREERPPHIEFNNKKYSKPDFEPYQESFKSPNSQTPEKNINGYGRRTFNVLNNKRDATFQKHSPRHLQSSYITEEYKTTSFFDDFLESNPSFPMYKDATKNQSLGCIRTKLANFFNAPMLNDCTEYYPHVCYMEPKFYNMPSQGIPSWKQQRRVLQPEPRMFSAYPESNISHSGLVERNEGHFQDDTLKLGYSKCCSCNKSVFENPQIAKTNNENLQQNTPNPKKKKPLIWCKSGKVNREELSTKPESPVSNENLQQNTPNPKKKKPLIWCKSGKVDREELSTKPETPVKKEQNSQFPKYQCCPSDINLIRKPYQEQISPTLISNRKIPGETHFKCSKDCPFKMQPEKEYHMGYTQPQPITKSVGCECGDKYPLGLPDNKIDAGGNITIQIIPNCCQTRISSEPVETFSNVDQRIPHPRNNCDQKLKPFEMQNDFPTQIRSSPVTYNYQEQYQRFASRERPFFRWWGCNWCRKKPQTPYHRNPNLVETRDGCTTTCEDPHETNGDRCEIVAMANCQRVLPIRNTYINRDANLLKSFHRLNKGLLQDLFATPCPSSSSGCHNSPLPIYADSNPYHPTKPLTINRCCQYEADCKEETGKRGSSKEILFECLRYLKDGMLNDCEYLDEDCCCCCRNYNSCCCCECTSRCCEREVFKPKIEVQKSKTCCTRCRSVEAKQSLKNCGTIVSNRCFETVCTNTETRPKTAKPEIRKRRVCCRRRCCCNLPRNCECCCGRCCNSGPCCQNSQKTPCYKGEHLIYCCQCEAPPLFDSVSRRTKESSVLETEMKYPVSKGTGTVTIKDATNAKFLEYSNTTEKSTNTNSTISLPSQIKDVLMRSLTLDLCDLGEKQFSKFGVPSRPYPWTDDSFFADMPREIYRFIGIEKFGNPLLEKEHDPTPCLNPEVIHDGELDKRENKVREQNAGGDIGKVGEVKKRYLSTICEAFFDCKQQKDATKNYNFLSITNNEYNSVKESNSGGHFQLENEMKNNEKLKEKPSYTEVQTVEETQKLNDEKNLPKQIATKNKNPSKSKSKTSQSITKSPSNISKKSSNISKVSSNTSTSKPFTTRTGLISFIPPFRGSCKSSSPVKTKQKPPLKTDRKNKTSKTECKNKDENTNKISTSNVEKLFFVGNNKVLLNAYNITQQNEEMPEKTEFDNKKEVFISRDLNIQNSNGNNDSGVELKTERKESRGDEETNENDEKIDEPFNVDKFNEEINAFYEKCFKTSNTMTAESIIPFYNTSVSDIVKSLESRYAVSSSQFNEKARNEENPVTIFPDEECNNITFPNKSNIEFYSGVFRRSYEQNNMQIPNKIMSKSDLITLN